MKNILLLTALFLVGVTTAFAQKTARFYKGTIGTNKVELYLRSEQNECTADTDFSGMYHYGQGTNWIQTSVYSDNKGNFTFVEVRLTGTLVLSRKGDLLEGIWISPDGKKQLKVKLNILVISKTQQQLLEEKFERTNYENYDC